MGEGGTILIALYGTVLGARHALEPDHLAAVSTMAAHGSSHGPMSSGCRQPGVRDMPHSSSWRGFS